MTRDHDFKQLIRERMRVTGENYTSSRAALLGENDGLPTPARHEPDAEPPTAQRATAYERAASAQRRAVRPFIGADGRLRSIPSKRSARMAVLLELVARFEPGRHYDEKDVNAILRDAHEDYAYLRRELVTVGYVERADGIYTLAARVPERDARWAHEFPEWERVWLPTHLARSVTERSRTGS